MAPDTKLVSEVKKAVFSSQILGVFPYYLDGIHFRLSILRIAHLFLMASLITFCLLLSVLDGIKGSSDSPNHWIIAKFKQAVATTISVGTMLSMLFVGPKLDRLMETGFKSQEAKPAYLNLTFSYHRLESAAHFAAIIVLFAGEVNVKCSVEYVKIICGTSIADFIIVAFINQFVGMAAILREEFLQINRRFSKPTLEVLESSVIAFERLTSASDSLNQAYGTQLLLMVGGNFLLVTTNAFQIINVTIGSRKIVYALYCAFSAWSPLRLVKACVALVNESKEFNVLLSSILVEEKSYGLTESARLRLHLSMKKEIVFTARGFFVLNYSLISAMLGAVATYLVILVQFDDSTGKANV